MSSVKHRRMITANYRWLPAT